MELIITTFLVLKFRTKGVCFSCKPPQQQKQIQFIFQAGSIAHKILRHQWYYKDICKHRGLTQKCFIVLYILLYTQKYTKMNLCYHFELYCKSDLEEYFLVVPANIWCHGEALRLLNWILFRQSWSRDVLKKGRSCWYHWDCRTCLGLQSKTACNRDDTNTVAAATAVRLYSCCSTLLANFTIR